MNVQQFDIRSKLMVRNMMCYLIQEGEALGAYGEWVPVDKTAEKPAASSKVSLTTAATSSSGETSTEVMEQPAFVADNDSVFPDPPLQVRHLTVLCL